MGINSIKLTVFFEDPFYVGIFEKTDDNGYSVAKKIFGSEPTDLEIYQFILKHCDNLKFTSALQMTNTKNLKLSSPKKRKREAQQELRDKKGIKKAYAAIKIEQEQTKKNKNKTKKLRTEQDQIKKFELKQIKKKRKHKGH